MHQHIPNKTKLAIIISIFLWGSAFVGIRAGLQEYTPGSLALLRFIVASMCMGLVYWRSQQRSQIPFRDVCGLLGAGVVGIGFYNICLNYGELTISSGASSFIISQSPIITAMLAVVFLGERLTLTRIAGFVIGIISVALMAAGEKGGFELDIGMFYVLLAAFAGACLSIIQKPYLRKYRAIESTTLIIWGGTLFLLLYTPQLWRDLSTAHIGATLIVVYLGVFPAAIGYLAWSYALASIPASRVVSYLYFVPFAATLLGWLFLGEVPSVLSFVGGVLAIIGAWVVHHSYRMPKTQ